jgi:hypothetical protein
MKDISLSRRFLEISQIQKRLRTFIQEYKSSNRFLIVTRRWLSILILVLLTSFVLLAGYGILIALDRFAAWLSVTPKIGPLDIPTLVTLLVVEGLFESMHRIFGTSDKPIVQVWNTEQEFAFHGCVYHGVSVLNRGGNGAMDCQAQLTLEMRKDNILDLREKKAEITSRTFSPIFEEPIRWIAQDAESLDLRPDFDHREPLFLLRVVPRRGNVPLHFEVPSLKGWSPMLVALKPDYYEGRIKISPMNGKTASQTFIISYDSKTNETHLSFPFTFFRPRLQVTST